MTYIRLTAIIDRLQPFIHRDKPETQIHLMQTVAPNMYNDCTHSHVVNADMHFYNFTYEYMYITFFFNMQQLCRYNIFATSHNKLTPGRA